MKTLIMTMLMATLITACGSGGGGGSASGGAEVPAGNNFMDRQDSSYELRVNGCNGSTMTMVAFINPGTVDEVRHDFNSSIVSGNSFAIVLSGKAIAWEVDSISGGCSLTMQLTRNTGGAIFIDTDTIPSNGQTGYVQDY